MIDPQRPQLTPTQWHVLDLVAASAGNAAIAAALGVEPNTVEGYMKAIYRRLPHADRGDKRAAAAT